jgi:hypothetical protein
LLTLILSKDSSARISVLASVSGSWALSKLPNASASAINVIKIQFFIIQYISYKTSQNLKNQAIYADG